MVRHIRTTDDSGMDQRIELFDDEVVIDYWKSVMDRIVPCEPFTPILGQAEVRIESKRVASIWSVHTHQDFRRQGIARTVMQAAMDWAIKQGCTEIWLQATTMAQPLYEKLGFKFVNEKDRGCYGARMEWKAERPTTSPAANP